jgi:hypothetical protein
VRKRAARLGTYDMQQYALYPLKTLSASGPVCDVPFWTPSIYIHLLRRLASRCSLVLVMADSWSCLHLRSVICSCAVIGQKSHICLRFRRFQRIPRRLHGDFDVTFSGHALTRRSVRGVVYKQAPRPQTSSSFPHLASFDQPEPTFQDGFHAWSFKLECHRRQRVATPRRPPV